MGAVETFEIVGTPDDDRISVSMLALHTAERGFVGPGSTTLNIDIQSSLGAPGDELIRVEVRADYQMPLTLELGFDCLRLALPLIERLGEDLAIRHDLHDPLVISAAVPRNADRIDLPTPEHTRVLRVGCDGRTITEGRGASSASAGGAA